MLVVVIYSKQRACKGGGFSESDEDCLVNLSGRVSFDAYKEQRHAPKDDQCGDDELDDICLFIFHKFVFIYRNLSRRRPLLPFRWKDVPGAKVQQKNEPTKKVSSLWFKVEQNQPLERS